MPMQLLELRERPDCAELKGMKQLAEAALLLTYPIMVVHPDTPLDKITTDDNTWYTMSQGAVMAQIGNVYKILHCE